MEIYPKVGNLTARVVLCPFILVWFVWLNVLISSVCLLKARRNTDTACRSKAFGSHFMAAVALTGARVRPYTFPGEIGIVPMRQTHILVFRILNLLPPRRDLFGRRCGRQKKRRNENPKRNPRFIRDSECTVSLPTPCSLA